MRLIECDVHPQGLYHLLRLPRNLASLTITEANQHSSYSRDRRYDGLTAAKVLHPLHSLQPFLQHLCIARLSNNKERLFCISPLDLTPFTSLQSVEFAHVQAHRSKGRMSTNWCDSAHTSGPQLNTGAPSTTTLIYSDIPPHWWSRGIDFFACAFQNKVTHGIEKLQTLKLVLVDDELLTAERARALPARELGHIQERMRRKVRQLAALGRRDDVRIRVVVEWVRPNGHTIPPYLMGEYVPEIRPEYDSGPLPAVGDI